MQQDRHVIRVSICGDEVEGSVGVQVSHRHPDGSRIHCHGEGLLGSGDGTFQAPLSQLYLEMGRDEDARKIEDKLRRSLALADADHPILRQLDRTKELALREAAN